MNLLSIYLFCIGILACASDNLMPADTPDTLDGAGPTDTVSKRLLIRVGQRTFTATLLNNATTAAFKARLPLTLSMRELNGNEKYGDFTPGLPTNAANPGTIQTGDLMLYGSSTLVLFYESLPTSYSYTRLGRIDDLSGLARALGNGNVMITFDLAYRQK